MPKHAQRTIKVKQPEEALSADARNLCCGLLQGWQSLSSHQIEVDAHRKSCRLNFKVNIIIDLKLLVHARSLLSQAA